jgi:hypothetical protein
MDRPLRFAHCFDEKRGQSALARPAIAHMPANLSYLRTRLAPERIGKPTKYEIGQRLDALCSTGAVARDAQGCLRALAPKIRPTRTTSQRPSIPA